MQYLSDEDCAMKKYTNNNCIEFNSIDTRLTSLGFSDGQKNGIYTILSAILNLGNIQFENLPYSDDRSIVTEKSQLFLDHVAVLLKINRSTLQDAFISRTINVAGSEIQYVCYIFTIRYYH